MRILVITNRYPPCFVGGYELSCQDISNELRRRGHAVRVLTTHVDPHRAPSPEHEPDVMRALHYRMPHMGRPPLPELCRSERHDNRILRDTVRDFRPDVAHVFSMYAVAKSLCLTLQRLRLPTVYDVSDQWIVDGFARDPWLRWWSRPRRGAARVRRWLWSRLSRDVPRGPASEMRFDRIYFCSRAMRDAITAAGWPVSHGEVIYRSIDTKRFTGSPRIAPLRRLLYVGRLAPEKGVLTVLRALAQIADPPQLTICGRGDPSYEQQLRALAAEHGLAVQFCAVEPAAMPETYRAHDALIFPSEWAEPFGRAPLEALACGLPIVTTLTGGTAELFRHGENALTYDAGNAEQLAQRIRTLVADEALRHRLARQGQDEVHRSFSLSASVDRIEAYLAGSLHATAN